MTNSVPADAGWMAHALSIGQRGRGLTFPNPSVGAVLVKENRVVGRGVTQPGGRPHAEAVALDMAGSAAEGATLYVTLEPCAHKSGRGPSCTGLLVNSGVPRIVVALPDPDPRTAGKGIETLRTAGKTVDVGVGKAEAERQLAGFLLRQRERRPFVTLKLATSLDGFIAMPDGTSQWITGAEARAHAHLERAHHDVILVGSGTLKADRPQLDVRLPGLEGRSPRRAVMSGSAVPEGWLHVRKPTNIGKLNAHWLLVEGGAGVAASMLAADRVDRLLLYRAPIVMGNGRSALNDFGLETLADAHGRWVLADTRMLGNDRMESYERVRASPEG